MEAVLQMCIQALSFMRLTQIADIGVEIVTVVSEEVLSSIFLPKTDPCSIAFCVRYGRRPLEAATDNVAFVPISMDFMANGLGIPEALVETFKTMIATNDNTYFVLVMGKINGKPAVVGGNSFIAIP